jgi:hypothetical protein
MSPFIARQASVIIGVYMAEAEKNQKKTGQKKWLWALPAVVAIFCAIMILNTKSPAWPENYQDAYYLALQESKPLLVIVYRDRLSIGPVEHMFNGVYKDSNVVSFLKTRFIVVPIDIAKDKEMKAKFPLNVNPSHYVIDPISGKTINSLEGPQSAADFLKWLTAASEQIKSDRTKLNENTNIEQGH